MFPFKVWVLEKFTEGSQTVIILDKDVLEHITFERVTLSPQPSCRPLAGNAENGRTRMRFDGDPGYQVGAELLVSEVTQG